MSQKVELPSQHRPITIDESVLDAARVMVEASRLASRVDATTDVLHGVLDGLAALVHQDAAGVYVTGKSGRRLRHTLFRGCDPQVPDLEAPFDGKGIVGDVLAFGKPLSCTAAESSEAFSGRPCAKSRLVVPIVGSDQRVLGALDLWSDRPDGYDNNATELVTLYGVAVASALEGARLHAEISDKRELDSDMALAHRVMEGLLPNSTPQVPGFDIAGSHESSHSVGGDYYEFIPLVDDRWGVVIADVVGKGIPAALLVSALRASISALVGHELAIRAVMRRANRFFHESVEDGKYVTLFYAVIDPPRRSMRVACRSGCSLRRNTLRGTSSSKKATFWPSIRTASSKRPMPRTISMGPTVSSSSSGQGSRRARPRSAAASCRPCGGTVGLCGRTTARWW
jgi:sigma-B regulation protein RsbU (phosphoserine phosphatase)